MLERFAAITLEVLAADLVSVWLTDGGEGPLTLEAQAGERLPDADIPHRPERDRGLTGCILTSGRPLAISGLDHDRRVWNRAWYGAQEIRSFLGVPLLVNGAAAGVIACLTRTRRVWSADDIEHAEALATAAAVAIANARLHAETQERLTRLRGLTALNHAVTSSDDLHQVLDRITESTVQLVHADVARLWVVDEAKACIRLATTRSRDAEDVCAGPSELPLDDPCVAAILASGVPRPAATAADDPLQADTRWARAGGAVSRVSIPLIAGARVLGVLAVLTRASQTAEELELLTFVAAKAATALENARLYTGMRQQLRQNQTLLDVARAANSTLDFTEVMRRVARTIGLALDVDMVGAYLPDPGGRVLRPVAGYHVPRELLPRFMEFPVSIEANAYISEGWQSHQPVWCADAQNGGSDPELLAWAPIRSVIFFPLVVKDAPIGALFLIWWAPRTPPTPLELQLLEGVARQTALAIGNARLFEARVRDAQRLQALNEVSRSLTAILDPGEVVATIAKFAAELIDARLVRLWLLDRASGELVLVASGGDDAPAAAALTPLVRVAPGTGLVGSIFARCRAEFIADLGQDDRWLNPALSAELGLRGFAGVPLVLKDDVIGVLSLMTRRLGDFSDSQRSLIEAFTLQAALALHNARTFDELQRRLRETEALLGVAESLGHAGDIGEIMRRVCREAARALGADSAAFYVADEHEGRVFPAAGYHIPKAALAEAGPLHLTEVPAPIVDARRARRILFVHDVPADPQFDLPSLNALGVRSLMMSPIGAANRLFGDVLLYWRQTPHTVTDDDLALMAAISAQAALALENARLLAETRSQATALREKNAELDSFVYTVSHDLKAPLVTIQGMSGIVLEEYAGQLDEDGRHYLERIVVNTQQMERLILDLLALSRSGREGRDPEEVHLAELVDDCVSGLSAQLQARGIKVVVGDLPSVWAVRVQMEQVMRNLLTNAIKYMGDAASPAIHIGAIARPGAVEIWVRDTGIGIDPAYHDKIFEIFQRLKEVEAEGTGVGLPIVKKIVHAAGGRIWVESAPGAGSTFRFTWPIGPRR